MPIKSRLTIDFGHVIDAVSPRPKVTLRVPVRRPDDLLVFDVVFDNLKLVEGTSPRLQRVDASARLTIEFPPQSFGEEAFLEAAAANGNGKPKLEKDKGFPSTLPPLPPLPTSRIRMAGRSRIVLSMPADQATLSYDLASVLKALRTWPMRLDVNATEDVDPSIFGRLWLGAVVSSQHWKTIVGGVSAGVVAANPGIDRVLTRAARSVSERAATSLARGTQEDLRSVVETQMQTELDRLAEHFPNLREGDGRDAGAALLAAHTVEQLANRGEDFAFGPGGLSVLPFLPILLGPHEPSRSVTALELPYRLMLSPIGSPRWQHADVPVARHGRTELWHTRLRSAAGDHGADGESRIRALWSPDYDNVPPAYDPGPPPKPPIMSLDPQDRDMLVRLMAGFDEKNRSDGWKRNRPYAPRSSEARRLHLSALGALLDAEGHWEERPTTADIQEWHHLASLGRDHYVKVMYAGYLCPFGHAASLIKVTERKFQPISPSQPKQRIAVLRQRFYIVVREHVRTYAGAGHRYSGHNFPLRRVEITTNDTPDLYPPGKAPSHLANGPAGAIYSGAVTPRMVFWPMVPFGTGAKDVFFDIAATDILGHHISFAMPLLFIGEIANGDATRIAAIKSGYNAPGVVAKRRAQIGGQTVAYAKLDPADKGDPRLPTRSITFCAGDVLKLHQSEPNFYPEIEDAETGIRAVQKMLGLANFVQPVTYPQVFKEHAFDPGKNPGQVFLQLTQVANLDFGGGGGQAKSDALGALASPQMAILGLSKIAGPVSGKPPANPNDPAQIEAALGKIINNTFDPTEFFRGATILGGVSLASILEVAHSLAGDDVPKMLSRDVGDRIETSFDWKTTISKSDPLNLIIPNADGNKAKTSLEMHGLVTAPVKSPADADFSASAVLNNFKVNLFGFIIIWFELLTFTARKGQKPDVHVLLREGDDAVQFGGPLEFVNTLRELIPSNGFSDPPSLTVTPSGISAGYSLTLPTIGVGIFALSNASLGAAFNLPFDSRPASVKFNFSERQHPFSLTVSLLGGGGFFAIGVSARGVTEIEAALEFGAAVVIDLGVASGSVEVKAGIYFHWLEPVPDKGSIDLAGYVRIHGELTVIAIISVSLTFNLQLGYHKEAGKSTMYGEATLVVEVEVLFISVSVSVSCRREFAGAASDPKFIALMPTAAHWNAYCDAFAPELP